jgi:hypothetical protein
MPGPIATQSVKLAIIDFLMFISSSRGAAPTNSVPHTPQREHRPKLIWAFAALLRARHVATGQLTGRKLPALAIFQGSRKRGSSVPSSDDSNFKDGSSKIDHAKIDHLSLLQKSSPR